MGQCLPWTRNTFEKRPRYAQDWRTAPLNNPGRFQLMDLAEDFMKRAKELKRNGPNNKGNPNRKKMGSQAGLVPFNGPCGA
jgi:hypothetical protein